MKKAIITGISGQDGHFLSKILLAEGYQLLGTTRRCENARVASLIEDGVRIVETDYSSDQLKAILKGFEPDEVYHLAGQTFVGKSWLIPEETINSSGFITARILEIVRNEMRRTRFFHASSSEIYAPKTGKLSEDDPKEPANPYGCAKLLAHHMVNAYRVNFDLFAVNGILFNHESSLRQSDFFSKKLVGGIADIVEGKASQLKLGNLEITRDWGDSEEYMSAAFRMMQLDAPRDFNICTGVGVTVGEIVEAAFEAAGLRSRDHVVLEHGLVRSKEVRSVVGDPTRIGDALGWSAERDIFTIIRKMLNDEFERRGIR